MKQILISFIFLFISVFGFSQELKGFTSDSILVEISGFYLKASKNNQIDSSRITSCLKLFWKDERNYKVKFFRGDLILGEIFTDNHAIINLQNFK